jgi:hypothetical protein
MANLIGPSGQLFAEQSATPDAQSFQVDNTDSAYYKSAYYKQHQDLLQPVPAPLVDPPQMTLESVVGPDVVKPYTDAGRISFHAVGDTGPAALQHLQTEESIADAMTADLAGANAPAFLYHLGDVIYDFGEAEYWYDQFYEPFREYDRPIFAIPGNHDGMPRYGADPTTPLYPSLFSFLRNMCTTSPAHSPDAGALVRSTMTQPGVYFALDAPFVSIIGLYSNVLEGPGVISSQGGQYPSLDDRQVEFLSGQLSRLAPDRKTLKRAVIVAVHHPPASADTKSGGATGLANDIDRAARSAGFLPDVVLSGHAHLYQRFTRATGGRTIPYIVAGSGGHNVTLPMGEVSAATTPITWGEYTLEAAPLLEYGFLTVTVDMSSAARPTLSIRFTAPANPAATDAVTVDLSTGSIV